MDMKMDILETQLVQRDYDKRWELIGKIMDHDNAYTYQNESGRKVTYTPEKWITIKVYDLLMEFV